MLLLMFSCACLCLIFVTGSDTRGRSVSSCRASLSLILFKLWNVARHVVPECYISDALRQSLRLSHSPIQGVQGRSFTGLKRLGRGVNQTPIWRRG
jgi:hypothetical protein